MANVLFIGFEIGSKRSEAVSINYLNHLNNVIPKNVLHSEYALSSSLSFFTHMLNIGKYIKEINEIIKKRKITHVHDLFVLPLLSFFFAIFIKIKNSKVILIKELHNNYGFSLNLSLETILRLVMSNKITIWLVMKMFDKVYSRNKYISSLWKIDYIPQYINTVSAPRVAIFKDKIIKICYLGHTFTKKGVDLFPRLISAIDPSLRDKIVFNFAFSNIGKSQKIVDKINEQAIVKNLKVNYLGKVIPSTFLRSNHLFILPLQDEHSATSTPNTLLEAMEAGCVVITSKNPITSSVIANNKNGFIYSGDLIEHAIKLIGELVNHDSKFTLISKNAQKYIEDNHNKEYIKESFRNMYNI